MRHRPPDEHLELFEALVEVMAELISQSEARIMAAIDDLNTAVTNLDAAVHTIADTVAGLEQQIGTGGGTGSAELEAAIATAATGVQAAADNLTTIANSATPPPAPTPAPTPAPEPVPAPEPAPAPEPQP